MAQQSMNKLKTKSQPWVRGLVIGYLVLIVGIGVGMNGYYFSHVSGALADPVAADVTTPLTFDAYFCEVIVPIGNKVVESLTILMLLAAGVTYMVSLGQSSGEIGGISTAKSMIMAAVTGMLLWLMGTLLLGQCGFTPGGWITGLFS